MILHSYAQEALKHTNPDHPDRATLEAALVKVQNIVTVINQGSSQTDSSKRTLEIQNSFVEVNYTYLMNHFTLN